MVYLKKNSIRDFYVNSTLLNLYNFLILEIAFTQSALHLAQTMSLNTCMLKTTQSMLNLACIKNTRSPYTCLAPIELFLYLLMYMT